MYNTHNYYKLPRKNCFSFSTAERDIDIIKGKTPSINGHLKHYLGTMHKESEYRPPIKRFNKKYLPQPNSQRTIDPSLRTLEDTSFVILAISKSLNFLLYVYKAIGNILINDPLPLDLISVNPHLDGVI